MALPFEFTREEMEIREKAKSFAETYIAPVAAEFDERSEFPVENIKKLARQGFMGIPFPKIYGGLGLTNVAYSLAVIELAKVCASHGITVGAHTGIGCGPIWLFGTEEQKQKYLVPLAKGEKLASFGLTEPTAGSDAGGTLTTAELKGDHYVLNGSKIFITSAGYADVFVVTAVTEKSKGKNGISSFIVEKTFPGFIVGKKENKMGWRASDTRMLHFENMIVPKENLVGKEGEGFKGFLKVLDGGRVGMAALSLGIAIGAYEAALKFAKKREQFDQPIIDNQGIQFYLADMALGIECGWHLVLHAARLKDAGKPFTKEAAMAKLQTSEMAMQATIKAIQIHGAYGTTKDYPVERFFRDAKIGEIGEGTSEIQRLVIAREIIRSLG
ncbi:acyl-CoA dehydrogenase family protein [bacterium]|nr:acyl-CoA dehydrogenase family protein [bacterium]